MYSRHLLKPFALLASSICIVQASVWTVLSFIAILVNKCTIEIREQEGVNGDTFRFLLGTYIQGVSCENSDLLGVEGLLTPTDILIVMCFYLVTSLFWLAASAMVFSAFLQGELNHLLKILYAWIGTTAVTCVLDFVMTIMFGLDLDTVLHLPSTSTSFSFDTLMTVTATMMTLAAKGFILWIFNVSFFVYFWRVAYFMREEQKYNTGHSMSREPSLRSLGYHPPQAVNVVERKRLEQMWRNESNLLQSPMIGSEPRIPWYTEESRQNPQSFGSTRGSVDEPQQFQNSSGLRNMPREPPRQLPEANRGPWTTGNRQAPVQNEFIPRPPPMSRPAVGMPRVPLSVPPPQVPKSFPKPDYSPPQQHKKYEPRMYDQPPKSAMKRPPPLPPGRRTLF